MKYNIICLIISLFFTFGNICAKEYHNSIHKFSIEIPDSFSIVYESKAPSSGLVASFARNNDEQFKIYHVFSNDNSYDKKKVKNTPDEILLSLTEFKEWELIKEINDRKADKAKIYKVDDNLYLKVYILFTDGYNVFYFYATAPSCKSFTVTDDIVSSFSRKNFWITILLIAIGVGVPAFLFYLAKDNWGKNKKKVVIYGVIPLIAMIIVCLLCDFSLWWVVIALCAGLLGEIII